MDNYKISLAKTTSCDIHKKIKSKEKKGASRKAFIQVVQTIISDGTRRYSESSPGYMLFISKLLHSAITVRQ